MVCGAKAAITAIAAKVGKVRISPIHVLCSDRRAALDLPFMDRAAKEVESPN